VQAKEAGGSGAEQLPTSTNRCVAYTRTCPVHSAVDCILTGMHFLTSCCPAGQGRWLRRRSTAAQRPWCCAPCFTYVDTLLSSHSLQAKAGGGSGAEQLPRKVM
jgi:hypothetical protein